MSLHTVDKDNRYYIYGPVGSGKTTHLINKVREELGQSDCLTIMIVEDSRKWDELLDEIRAMGDKEHTVTLVRCLNKPGLSTLIRAAIARDADVLVIDREITRDWTDEKVDEYLNEWGCMQLYMSITTNRRLETQ